MSRTANPTPRRRRGRPRAGESDARERIREAAIDAFGESGYDGATIRAIAARAEVDSALVHHHYGTKADLFAQVAGMPIRPDREIARVLTGPREEIGAALVAFMLTSLDDPTSRKRMLTVVRGGLSTKVATPLLAGFIKRELVGRLAVSLDLPDAELRASLVASQMAGLLIARYVVELPALVEASNEELIARIGPTVQRYLFD